MYEYQESAKKHGIKIATFGFVLTAICLAIVLMMSSGGIVFAGILLIPIIACCLIALGGFLMLGVGITQIVRGGEFHITASNKGISWLMPEYLGDSFQYRLADIACINKITKNRQKKNGEIKTKINYVLMAKNGEEHKLMKQSDVSIDKVIDSLRTAGVELRESTA